MVEALVVIGLVALFAIPIAYLYCQNFRRKLELEKLYDIINSKKIENPKIEPHIWQDKERTEIDEQKLMDQVREEFFTTRRI